MRSTLLEILRGQAKIRFTFQTSLSGFGSTQPNLQRFQGHQGFSLPIQADGQNHAMLHRVPLPGPRRTMTNFQADVQLVRELLEVIISGAAAATVAAAAVGTHKPLGGLWIISPFHPSTWEATVFAFRTPRLSTILKLTHPFLIPGVDRQGRVSLADEISNPRI